MEDNDQPKELRLPVAPRVHEGASQTASDYIDEQLILEADAREILPYKFDKCTHDLGPLRQSVFACLTCNPPPASAAQVYMPAGVCYACSISCHGDHTLVELFTRRSFVCDCGTTRIPSSSPCTLRDDPLTGARGVTSQKPAQGNTYNQNYQNRFCGCGQEYDAETEKGTMYQCLGLGTEQQGGCGEDWWHPHCLMGFSSDWIEHAPKKEKKEADSEDLDLEDELPVPEGFPKDDDFTTLICYKCVEANPWIKPYAGAGDFLSPVYYKRQPEASATSQPTPASQPNLKRKASDEDEDMVNRPPSPSKRLREDNDGRNPDKSTANSAAAMGTSQDTNGDSLPTNNNPPKHNLLPSPAPSGSFSLFAQKSFRDSFCHCPQCFPNLASHPQLLEEEDEYQPSISDSQQSLLGVGPNVNGSGRSHGTASLLDRGEAALSNMDRVKAIEGVMAYNHLKEKLKGFLRPYAESGTAVGAEDIKKYFEKLRGDAQGIQEAGTRPSIDEYEGGGGGTDKNGDGGGNNASDSRKEQSGY